MCLSYLVNPIQALVPEFQSHFRSVSDDSIPTATASENVKEHVFADLYGLLGHLERLSALCLHICLHTSCKAKLGHAKLMTAV